MSKLRFDPLTYQFYYRCGPEDVGTAKAAGFSWDALRRRYYTVEPKVAAALASRADSYVKLLLADTLEPEVLHAHHQKDVRYRRTSMSSQNIAPASHTVH
jgi:hypothetical protein